MKVITATEMATLEKEAFKEGADADFFMQNAAKGIALTLFDYMRSVSIQKKVTFISGKGNNGGDGYCAALLLMEKGFHIEAFQLYPLEECSPLCKKYADLFKQKGGVIHFIHSSKEMPTVLEGILLDGVFGTGFKGDPPEYISEIFNRINQFKVPVFSIDIPSGLEGDTGKVHQSAVKADFTIFLGLPKKGFFIRDGWDHVGHLVHVDFGLGVKWIEQGKPEFEMLTLHEVGALVPEVRRSRHKYQAGYVVGISGSKGMMGASILSGVGALRAGAGMVKVIHLEEEFLDVGSYPELIHKTYNFDQINETLSFMEKATALYIGPGIGLDSKVEAFLKELLPKINIPCVLDADALTILSKSNLSPPKGAILTPHVGEAKRLLKLEGEDIDTLLKACQDYVNEKEVVLVLKGGPTFIFAKGITPTVNVTGDPGMATAGSGDVLTGMITALLSQENMDPLASAKLGVFLHGKAGEFAAAKKTSFATTATDILNSLHKAWLFLIRSIAT